MNRIDNNKMEEIRSFAASVLQIPASSIDFEPVGIRKLLVLVDRHNVSHVNWLSAFACMSEKLQEWYPDRSMVFCGFRKV